MKEKPINMTEGQTKFMNSFSKKTIFFFSISSYLKLSLFTKGRSPLTLSSCPALGSPLTLSSCPALGKYFVLRIRSFSPNTDPHVGEDKIKYPEIFFSPPLCCGSWLFFRIWIQNSGVLNIISSPWPLGMMKFQICIRNRTQTWEWRSSGFAYGSGPKLGNDEVRDLHTDLDQNLGMIKFRICTVN